MIEPKWIEPKWVCWAGAAEVGKGAGIVERMADHLQGGVEAAESKRY